MHAVMGGIVITDLCCKNEICKCKGEVKLQGRFFLSTMRRERERERERIIIKGA